MTLHVIFPDKCRDEKNWISRVVLGEWLGVPYRLSFDEGTTVRIAAEGKTLHLPDVFFSAVEHDWLLMSGMPSDMPQDWAVASSGLEPLLAGPAVPVIFGAPGFDAEREGKARLHLDIFGTAFFMLSRYEEAVDKTRDGHERFPSAKAFAARADCVERPVVDEYIEILWAAMHSLWPQLERKNREFHVAVTCDVDHPYHPAARSVPRLARRTAAELVHKRSWSAALGPLRNFTASRRGDWRHDPYYPTVDWMMDVNERAGNRMAFYFIPEITDPAVDDTCALSDPAVVAMIRRIADRRHEIGIHPGYHTYQSLPRLASGLGVLRQLLERHGVAQPVLGGRQHYLRWSTRTPAIWEAAGLQYDSTLGFAERAGFRCGTCHPYSMFDLHERKALRLVQRPLVCMEVSVIQHMGHGVSDRALAKMMQVKETVRKFKGTFTLLWHNSSFDAEGTKEMYQELIA